MNLSSYVHCLVDLLRLRTLDRGTFAFGQALSENHDLVLLINVANDTFALHGRLIEEGFRQLVIQEPHDGPSQGSSSIDRIVSFIHHLGLEAVSERQGDAPLLTSLEGLSEFKLSDLTDLLLVQRLEDDDLIQTVEELGPEEAFQLVMHLGLEPLVHGHVGIIGTSIKAQALSDQRLLNLLGSAVGGQNDQSVLERNDAALGVRQMSILQDLQH
mmetsp:Transcript_20104/g.33574  ORF Transcript_20104/g.33574 Transcript_20104/m.33574 type:complete len:214 (+) Transcript_20104:276-917(+)